MDSYLNAAEKVFIKSFPQEKRVGLVRDLDYLNSQDYIPKRADWPKFERFFKNNNIFYNFFDIRSSIWITAAEEFDIIIWHPFSSPASREEAESKIYFLEKYLKKICFPSFDEIWGYEHKVRASYLSTFFSIPLVPTFTTNSKTDAIDFINYTTFPIISKITTGSSSHDVTKIENRKSAIKFVTSCFSDIGRKTYWPYIRQKNYVYFQKFISDAKYDLRIIIVGNKIFGYYRYAKKGDFRASGAGIREKKALPEEAMRIALDTKSKLGSTSLAVDMLYSENEKKYYIIETSIFFGIDTPAQLAVNGLPGYYEYINDTFIFKEGRFWIQELALQHFFNSLFKSVTV
jgi:glutathione synthase/RimK-type ligase-like ATP-grasp enzyme